MRVAFLLSDEAPAAQARVFAMAQRGLAARGHDAHVVRAAATLELRRALNDVDVCFVHSEAEQMMASSCC